MQNQKQINNLTGAHENSEDLSKLFDYPSVGELFSGDDTQRFDELCAKLAATRQNLERIVRYGKQEEAEKASRAVKAVETTLEFLQNLQKMRQSAQK
jgi:hypothetical protein